MKKHILLVFALFSLTTLSFSQNITERHQTPVEIPSNIDRYKVDYELVDESLIATDNSILTSLNLDAIEAVRLETEDTIYFDEVAEIELRVYSVAKTAIRKNKTHSSYQQKH